MNELIISHHHRVIHYSENSQMALRDAPNYQRFTCSNHQNKNIYLFLLPWESWRCLLLLDAVRRLLRWTHIMITC